MICLFSLLFQMCVCMRAISLQSKFGQILIYRRKPTLISLGTIFRLLIQLGCSPKFFSSCLPLCHFDAYLCAPWVYSYQLFVPVHFSINSVYKSIDACNYSRLRDRSIDQPNQTECCFWCSIIHSCLGYSPVQLLQGSPSFPLLIPVTWENIFKEKLQEMVTSQPTE